MEVKKDVCAVRDIRALRRRENHALTCSWNYLSPPEPPGPGRRGPAGRPHRHGAGRDARRRGARRLAGQPPVLTGAATVALLAAACLRLGGRGRHARGPPGGAPGRPGLFREGRKREPAQTMPSSISACSRAFPYADGVLYEPRATNHHTVARTSTAISAIDA